MAKEGPGKNRASRPGGTGGPAGTRPGARPEPSEHRPHERQQAESLNSPKEPEAPTRSPSPPKSQKSRRGQRPEDVPAKGPRPGSVAARAAARDEARAAALERRVAEQRRRKTLQRRGWLRNGGVLGLIVIVVTGLIVWSKVRSGAAVRAFNQASLAAGCTPVKDTGDNLSHRHLGPGERVTYATSPPSGGDHNPTPLRAGVYTTAFSDDPNATDSIYQAVHSLEHGYVDIWYTGSASDSHFQQLAQEFAGETKVILSPYPQLPAGETIGLTTWGRLQTCRKVSVGQVRGFINRYRLKTAPEPLAP